MLSDTPAALNPYIVHSGLNDPITIVNGPFQLTASGKPSTGGTLNADLVLRWTPKSRVELEGEIQANLLFDLTHDLWNLTSGTPPFVADVLLTNIQPGLHTAHVRGVLMRRFEIGGGPFESLRFCLFNFPRVRGETVCHLVDSKKSYNTDRLTLKGSDGVCVVDVNWPGIELIKEAERTGGFVISHVGEWRPTAAALSPQDADEIGSMLQWWFGFMRGAWSGPIFLEGMNNQTVAWREIADWRADESTEVRSWLPTHPRLDLSSAFQGFVNLWRDEKWKVPLKNAISWLVEANSSRASLEMAVIVSQVALEMLAWVNLFEAERCHTYRDFESLSAAGRIRLLLNRFDIPTAVPSHFVALPKLVQNDAFDGPGVITEVRNALVHSTEKKRKKLATVSGEQLWECAEVARGYIELTLLAMFKYEGDYSRRGWRGDAAAAETEVPWMEK